jgi:glycerol-3-phosphate O-acyltransferase
LPAGADADPVAAFWDEIGRLRDLLKFEFYFKDREEHRRQVGDEMSRHDPAWEDRLRAGQAGALLAGMRPLVSHIMVRPFVEAYRIVADVLVHDDVTASSEDSEVTNRALGLGQQYVAQRRLRSSESVSVLLFQTGLQLARNRGLFEPTAGLAAGRADFLAELRHLVRRLDQIEDLAIKRYIRDAVSVMPAD